MADIVWTPVKDVKNLKLKLDGTGTFNKSPLLRFNDEDKEDGYEGKGIVKGYAHENNGRLYFSSEEGVGLFNVTGYAPVK